MTTVVFLDSISEAEHFIGRGSDPGGNTRIYTTHPSSKDFLDNRNIPCTDFSSLISESAYRAIWERAAVDVPALLAEMDKLHSSWLGGLLGLPGMTFFNILYGYTARCEYVAMESAKYVLERIYDGVGEHETRLYTGGKRSFFGDSDILLELLEGGYHADGGQVWIETLGGEARSREVSPFRNLRSLAGKVIRQVKGAGDGRRRIAGGTDPVIVAIQPLYDLKFMLDGGAVSGFPVMPWPPAGTPSGLECPDEMKEKIAGVPDMVKEIFSGKYDVPGADAPGALEESVTMDFTSRACEILEPLMAFAAFEEERGVAAVAWGNPGGTGARKLICAYATERGIPVIGMRHGGCTEIQDMGDLVFPRELDHCTSFLTYGATKDDIEKFFRGGPECNREVHPVGSTKSFSMASPETCEKKTDILLAITQVRGILARSYAMKSDRFYERQRRLLQYLDTRPALKTIVKPQSVDGELCAAPDTLAGLKHVEVVSGINLRDFLSKYFTRAIVLDVPSTPLYEVINMDVEIFLMLDAQLPLIPEALELLKKRVHCFEETGTLLDALARWESGELPSLRDNSFARRYVYKENAEENIKKIFQTVISHKNKQ